jgi:excisionase family DNA binding protein
MVQNLGQRKQTMPSEANTTVPVKYRLSDDQAAIIRRDPPLIMSVKESCVYVGLSERKLRQVIASGQLKVARIGAKIIIRRSSLDELLA